MPTTREVAEVLFVPKDLARTKRGNHRFLAVRALRDRATGPPLALRARRMRWIMVEATG